VGLVILKQQLLPLCSTRGLSRDHMRDSWYIRDAGFKRGLVECWYKGAICYGALMSSLRFSRVMGATLAKIDGRRQQSSAVGIVFIPVTEGNSSLIKA
jgi:hypothetical protein